MFVIITSALSALILAWLLRRVSGLRVGPSIAVGSLLLRIIWLRRLIIIERMT